MKAHPARFSPLILDTISSCLGSPVGPVLDPFAGTGLLSSLPIHTVCVEIEQDWATNVCADSQHLPFPAHVFDAVATSPTYGNRMADHHDARDGSKRHTYTHYLGHKLHDNNSGKMHFGAEYCQLHANVWIECLRVLKSQGLLVLNTKDFIRDGLLTPVTDWHSECLSRLGFTFLYRLSVPVRGLRHGANNTLRVDHEDITVWEAP